MESRVFPNNREPKEDVLSPVPFMGTFVPFLGTIVNTPQHVMDAMSA